MPDSQINECNKGECKLFAQVDTVNEPSLFTYWSILHFIVGTVAYVIYVNFLTSYLTLTEAVIIWVFINLAYEFKDFYKSYVSKTVAENSVQNSILDIVCCLLGFFFFYAIQMNDPVWICFLIPFYFVFSQGWKRARFG
jgi:hypothetical protein